MEENEDSSEGKIYHLTMMLAKERARNEALEAACKKVDSIAQKDSLEFHLAEHMIETYYKLLEHKLELNFVVGSEHRQYLNILLSEFSLDDLKKTWLIYVDIVARNSEGIDYVTNFYWTICFHTQALSVLKTKRR